MAKKRKKTQSDEQSKEQKLDRDSHTLDSESNESMKIPREQIYSNITTFILKHSSRKIKKERYQFKNIYDLKNLIPQLTYMGNRKEEFEKFIQQFTVLEADINNLIKLNHTLRKRLKTNDKNLKKHENHYFHYHFLWLKNTTLAFIHSNLLPFFESVAPQKELDSETLQQLTTLAPSQLTWFFKSIFRRNFDALRSLLLQYENPHSKNKWDQINPNISALSPPEVHDNSAEETTSIKLAENSQNTDSPSTAEIMNAITNFLSKKTHRSVMQEEYYEITSLFSLTSLIENNNHRVEDQLISYYTGSDTKGFIDFVQKITVIHADEYMLKKLQTNLKNRIIAPGLEKHELAYFEYHFLWLKNTKLAFMHSDLLHFFQLSFPREDLTLDLLEKHTKLNIFDLSRLLIAMFEQIKPQHLKRLRREITKLTADSINNQNANNTPEKNPLELELEIENLSPTTMTRIITDVTNIDMPDIQPSSRRVVFEVQAEIFLEPHEETVAAKTNLINTQVEIQNPLLEMRILSLENHVEAKRENFDRIINFLSEMHIQIINLENQVTELETLLSTRKKTKEGTPSHSNLHISTPHEAEQSPSFGRVKSLPYDRTSSRFFSISPTNHSSESQSPINQEMFSNTNANNTTESRIRHLEQTMAIQNLIEQHIEKTLADSRDSIFQIHQRISILQEKNQLQTENLPTIVSASAPIPASSPIASSKASSPFTNFFLVPSLNNESNECSFHILEIPNPSESPGNI